MKGSTRNRHVQSTGRENEVLLDENLVQSQSIFLPGLQSAELNLVYLAAHLAPFYLREHSKRILRGALYNDSKFLSDINVMDYSLVVGVDSQKNELVVGIVGESSNILSHRLQIKLFVHRLYTHLYLGQKIRKLGQRVCIPRRG